MKKVLVLCVLATALFACNKNKFKTQPQVEINSFGPDIVVPGSTFSFKAVVRDKEGDLQDTLIIYRKTYNVTTGALVKNDSSQTYNLKTLGVPVKDEINIQLNYAYGTQDFPDYYLYNTELRDTYLAIGIVIRDKAGHRSDYVESGKILLKK